MGGYTIFIDGKNQHYKTFQLLKLTSRFKVTPQSQHVFVQLTSHLETSSGSYRSRPQVRKGSKLRTASTAYQATIVKATEATESSETEPSVNGDLMRGQHTKAALKGSSFRYTVLAKGIVR